MRHIVEETDKLSGEILQKAIDDSNGTYSGIKHKLEEYKQSMIEQKEFVVVSLINQALDTLEYEIKDFKPFE